MHPRVHANAAGAVRAIAGEARGASLAARLRPFYGGWRVTGAYDVVYNVVQFTLLEAVRAAERAARRRGRREGGAPAAPAGRAETARRNVAIGALTGALTSLATEPLDVVRTRLLTQRRVAAAGGAVYYRSWAHCVRTIAREEGRGALFKGSIPRLTTVALSSSLWLAVYAVVKDALVAREKARAARAGRE